VLPTNYSDLHLKFLDIVYHLNIQGLFGVFGSEARQKHQDLEDEKTCCFENLLNQYNESYKKTKKEQRLGLN